MHSILRLAAGTVALGLGGIAPLAAGQTPSTLVGDEATGEETYSSLCRTCHGGLIAPTLRGVVGRPVASVADFGGYSPALKAKSDMTWTDANLDAFLKSPPDFAPGTLMTKNVPEDQARADVIAFLKTLEAPK